MEREKVSPQNESAKLGSVASSSQEPGKWQQLWIPGATLLPDNKTPFLAATEVAPRDRDSKVRLDGGCGVLCFEMGFHAAQAGLKLNLGFSCLYLPGAWIMLHSVSVVLETEPTCACEEKLYIPSGTRLWTRDIIDDCYLELICIVKHL